MKIDPLSQSIVKPLQPLQPPSWTERGRDSISATGNRSFADYLKNALNEVNQLQQEAARSAMDLAQGAETEIHNTMIAYEKAALALQLTLEVRNRLVEAYQEIMRMQM